MGRILHLLVAASLLLAGCASVPWARDDATPEPAQVTDGSAERAALNARVYDAVVRHVVRRFHRREAISDFRAHAAAQRDAVVAQPDEAGLYAGQLRYANAQIKGLVQRLLSVPEASRPIVVIQADEGPLLCRSVDCPEVSAEYAAVRFGILNALYLPGIEEPLPDVWTPVNTFRIIFREYFGADLEPLPDRSYTWPDNEHIYDFQDVTDLLDAPD